MRESHDADWRRYEGNGYFVELGPFEGRKPRKILVLVRFRTRADAIEFANRVSGDMPTVPYPRIPIRSDDSISYRATIVTRRQPIGWEVDVSETEGAWRVTITLIRGGPRILTPIESNAVP